MRTPPNTWTNLNVTVGFACAETGAVQSLLASDTVGGGGTQSAETSNGSFTNTGACADNAGNSANSATFSPIKVDKTKPVITASATTTAGAYLADTWTKLDVTVGFACAETGAVQSLLASDTVGGGTLTTETATGSITNTGACADNAGNTADSATFSPIKIDKTGPTLSVTHVSTGASGFQPAEAFNAPGTTFPVDVGNGPASSAGTAGDGGGSGVATVTVNGAAATGTTTWSKTGTALLLPGSTATVVATDSAGNTTSTVAATLNPDLDGDGIANNIDGDSTGGGAVGQARTVSLRFSDKALGGATSGRVQSLAAGATVLITEVANPKGVRVAVSGSGNGRFSLDGKAGTTTISAGGSGVLTDPPATTQLEMELGEGTIEFVIDGAPVVVTVAPGATATVTETYTDGQLTSLEVAASPESPPGSVTVNGEPVGTSSLTATLTLKARRFELVSTLNLPTSAVIKLPRARRAQCGFLRSFCPVEGPQKGQPERLQVHLHGGRRQVEWPHHQAVADAVPGRRRRCREEPCRANEPGEGRSHNW